MNKSVLKSSLKVTSNILLFLSLALMVVTVWLENFYVAVAAISVSGLGIIVSLFSNEGISLKIFTKDLNLYFFIVSIIISVSVIVANKTLFYVGLVLFLLMIFLYLIPLFVTEKEDKPSKNKKNKKK